jgi:hypothetical protein
LLSVKGESVSIEFKDGFESGNLLAWNDTVTTNGSVSVESINPRFGTYHFRGVTLDGATQKRAAVIKMVTESSIKNVRGYFFWNPGPVVASSERITFISMYPGVNAPTNYLCAMTLRGSHLIIFYRDATTYKEYDTGIVLTSGIYRMFELGCTVGAGNGEVKAYVDGQQVASLLNLTNNEWGGITQIRMGVAFADAVAAQTVDMDEVAIAPTYIGPFQLPATPINPLLVVGGLIAVAIAAIVTVYVVTVYVVKRR